MMQTRRTNTRRALSATLSALLFSLLACGGLNPGTEPTAAPVVTITSIVLDGGSETLDEPTATPPPTAPVTLAPPTLVPTPTIPPEQAPETIIPTPTITVDDDLVAELTARIEATIPLSSAENPNGGFEGVEVVPVGTDDSGRPLFAAHSLGLRGGGPAHFVSLHAHDGAGWQDLGQVDIDLMDILFPGSLTFERQVGILWLELSGGIGAHGNCYDLIRWDGAGLYLDLTNCHSSYAATGLTDYNEDGLPEVGLNQTDDYIYCYACLVRRPAMMLMSWTGQAWTEISLRRLGDDVAPELKAANDRAVDLAAAGVWAEAQQVINTLPPDNDILRWNIILINEMAAQHREAAEFSPLPLLNYVFLGDYEAAVDELRAYAPQDIFTESPLVFEGTPAVGYELLTAELIRDQMNLAAPLLTQRPALLFLRGWAQYLIDPANPALAQVDIEQADALAPTDPLYADSLFFFINDIGFR